MNGKLFFSSVDAGYDQGRYTVTHSYSFCGLTLAIPKSFASYVDAKQYIDRTTR